MDNGQWIYTALDQLDSVLEIPCINLAIPLAALYEAIILDNKIIDKFIEVVDIFQP